MTCRAVLEDDIFILENDLIRREYVWNNGHLHSRRMLDKRSGSEWRLTGERPDLILPENRKYVELSPEGGGFTTEEIPETAVAPAHLRVTVEHRVDALHIRRVFRLYEGVAAIACHFEMKGRTEARWRAEDLEPGALLNVQTMRDYEWRRLPGPAIEQVTSSDRHLKMRCVRFYEGSDRRNEYVVEHELIPYHYRNYQAGNLLLATSVLDDAGYFILKEAPCTDVQLANPGCDFLACTQFGEVLVLGLGLDPSDLHENRWTPGYGFVTGLAEGGEEELLVELREYQDRIRTRRPGRDEMILLNTWGDRNRDANVGEDFARKEFEAGARLGITHFQIDDGWQKGASTSSVREGSQESMWKDSEAWEVDPERFPNGLAPLVEKGRELGIELCLWFSPSFVDSYVHWERDAEALTKIWREHGVRMFKIDCVEMQDKPSEVRLRALFERVIEATGGEAVFNMDVTAGNRYGYHFFGEYGGIFMENRYTDWGNYYPHWTLRALWKLSRYVPAQRLQIEFLNIWRNRDKYRPGDPLAPGNAGFEYCFAVAMMAQPLAWMEASNLPEEAFALSNTIATYKRHWQAIHAGKVFPIGSPPRGDSWTGFQSLGEECGYFLVFREQNDKSTSRMKTWRLAGRKVACRSVLGRGEDFEGEVDEDGMLEFALPEPMSYALYAYEAGR